MFAPERNKSFASGHQNTTVVCFAGACVSTRTYARTGTVTSIGFFCMYVAGKRNGTVSRGQ